MRSLRMRVFVTVAIVLAAATVVSGLLSRRATLIEERQILGPRRLPPLDGVTAAIQTAFASGGWSAVRRVLADEGPTIGARLLAVDRDRHPVAASAADLETVDVSVAKPDGTLSLETNNAGARSRMEIRGGPAILVRDASGAEAGLVFVLPRDGTSPPDPAPLLPGWIAATLATALVALVLAFAVSRHVLRPVGELTAAARRMREGDLHVRVTTHGDDEIARLGDAFNAMAERLDQTERLKRQMVTDVAHELRSPVTNLRCGLEAIQDGLAAPDRDRIDALHRDTLLLQRLISDLQDLALADAGGLAIARQPVDVATVIRRAIGAVDGGPPIAVSVDPHAARVSADEGRVEQMLRNLIDNARRHTPPDGRIDVTATRAGAAVAIAVADSGCGIAAEHLPYLFDRFYRADQSRTRATGGAGLGLAIVRRLAEAHGGGVSAASAGAGRGATFTLRLPAQD
jgi:signal transduction histidine kinase